MNFPILKKIPLFYGVKPEEIPSILHCLSGQIRSFSKGEMIFCAGESITSVGIVLEGSVHIEIDDFWGSKNIFGLANPDDVRNICDAKGNSFVDAMKACGFTLPNAPLTPRQDIKAFVELLSLIHI